VAFSRASSTAWRWWWAIAYRDSPLKNLVNDARAMRDNPKPGLCGGLLREPGAPFGAPRRVSQPDRPGSVALFFAGHGLQVRGENYLPTVDELSSEEVLTRA
jgi:hypothetical protein